MMQGVTSFVQSSPTTLPGSPPARSSPSFAGLGAAPDLLSVFCVPRPNGLCYAAGGFLPPNPIQLGVSQNGFVLPAFGQVLISANAQLTSWKYSLGLPLTVPRVNSAPLCPLIPATTPTNVSSPAASLCPVPGLAAIATDPSGSSIWAVGAPAELLSIAGQPNIATFTPVTGAGIILFSANAGATFVVQSAPLESGRYYTLTCLVVPKRAVAVAGGGSPVYLDIPSADPAAAASTPSAAVPVSGNVSSGVVIYTMNQGSTWVRQPLPALGVGGVNGLAFYTWNSSTIRIFAAMDTGLGMITLTLPASAAVRRGGYWTWPTGSYTQVSLPSKYRPRAASSSYSPTLNPGRINVVSTGTAIYGVVWNNALKGYAYGTSLILSTADGGMTWYDETPLGMPIQQQITSAAFNGWFRP